MTPGFSVYVHLPFCRRRCTYCDFTVAVAMGDAFRRRYVDAVLAEWRGEDLPAGPIDTVYFGGGTPSLTDPADIARLLEAFAARAPLRAGAEVTLEANPGTVTPGRLRAYRAAGVNRLSLGVQAVQAHHLAALHRDHDVGDAWRSVRWARRAGIQNVSVDAIYGLPGQTVGEWRDTVDTLVSFEPEHISLYSLQVEEGTALGRAVARGAAALPQEDAVGDMADYAERRLPAEGYRRYEVSNFSRPGRESQHNRAYWRHRPYVGIGAGAHSFSGWLGSTGEARRWWNGPNVRAYVEAALSGRDPQAGEERVSAADAAGEAAWLALREVDGLDAAAFEARFGVSVEAAFPGVVPALTTGHLAVWAEGRLRLTRRGLAVGNQVFSRFLSANLTPEATRQEQPAHA
jgi:oxygen-independent coproporphyrinogen-3 oxidase